MKKLRADWIQETPVAAHSEYAVFPSAVKIKIYRTVIVPVVLYEYETWSLTLRGKNTDWGVREKGA
jgi:hypothetical protein